MDEVLLDEVLGAWQAQWPDVAVMALLPEREVVRLPVLQGICQRRGISLFGGVFPQLIDGDQLVGDGVWLLAQERGAAYTLVPDLPDDPADAALRIANALSAVSVPDEGQGSPTLYLMFDSDLQHIGSILEGLYQRVADRFRYAGVCTGSDTFEPIPCLFDRDRLISRGVLCAVLPPASRTALAHCYPVPEHVLSATATQGNRIVSIDWQPAFEVYSALVRKHYGVELTKENFYTYAVHFPIGLLRANGDVLVRIPVLLNEDGSLTLKGEVPEHAMLVVLRGPDALGTACVDALDAALGPHAKGKNACLFYCAGRRMHMGEAVHGELATVQARLHAPVMGGALSLGEVGNPDVWGYPMFHNAALVCTTWHGR